MAQLASLFKTASGNVPLRVVFGMIIASTVVVVFIMWQVFTSFHHLEQIHHVQQELGALGSETLFHHAESTNNAHMYTLKGGIGWKERYEQTKQALREDLKKIDGFTPKTFAERKENLDSSGDRLAEMDKAAFLLQEHGYPLEGMDLLSGDAYTQAKETFFSNLVSLQQDIQNVNEQTEASLRSHLLERGIAMLAVFAALIFMWLMGLALLLRWEKKVRAAMQRQVRAESELDRQSLFLDTIIKNLPVGLFAKNVAENYRWDIWNKKAEELFGLPASKAVGSSDFDHFPEHEARFFRQMDEKAMAEGKIIDIEEEEVTTSRGKWLAHTIKVPIYNDDGTPSMLLGIIEDITVRKQQADQRLQSYADELERKNTQLEEARSKAEEADMAKSQFLATMSHEIRTPLNGVIGTADLLSRTALAPQQDDYVRTIQKSGETLLYVINDILDLTKLESRQLGLENISFDFSNTVEDVIDIHSANAGKKELDLLLRYSPGTPARIYGDPGRLRQILNNLISNAIKFTESGHVLVQVEILPEDVLETSSRITLKVSVQDTGIGIAPENLGKMFQRFTQAEASTTRRFGGTGLGLAICKQLVELMGGQIGIESTPGKGSSFWFTLPTVLDASAPRALETADIQNKTVMVVDDNTVNLGILEELLRYWNCKPLVFESGNAALDWLAAAVQGVDIAIIDHDMPEMSGADLGENLRMHPLTATIPLLALSSRGMRGDTSFFEEKGFNGYLVKPCRPDDLYLMLSTLIRSAEAGTLGGIITRHSVHDSLGSYAETARPEGGNLRFNLRVMVVEDDPVNQKVVRLMLEELGCDVHVASSGLTGIEGFKAARDETKFDLILMDMQMPEMDGPEAAEVMRRWEAEHGFKRTPIIALTANAMAEHRDRCLAAGMDDYMTKPINHTKLVEHIRNWFKPSVMGPASAVQEQAPVQGLTPEQQAELQDVFRSSARECLTEMDEAALFDDTIRLSRAAHRLKGAAATFGYVTLKELCSQTETDPSQVGNLLPKIRKELNQVLPGFDA